MRSDDAHDRLNDLLERASAWGADGSGRDGLNGFLHSAARRRREAGEPLMIASDVPAYDGEARFAALVEHLLKVVGAHKH